MIDIGDIAKRFTETKEKNWDKIAKYTHTKYFDVVCILCYSHCPFFSPSRVVITQSPRKRRILSFVLTTIANNVSMLESVVFSTYIYFPVCSTFSSPTENCGEEKEREVNGTDAVKRKVFITSRNISTENFLRQIKRPLKRNVLTVCCVQVCVLCRRKRDYCLYHFENGYRDLSYYYNIVYDVTNCLLSRAEMQDTDECT